jgi:hypothetical protein
VTRRTARSERTLLDVLHQRDEPVTLERQREVREHCALEWRRQRSG